MIEALEWLKLHHTEYNDITIIESNLNWMKDKCQASVIEQVCNYQVNSKMISSQQPSSASKVQCFIGDDPDLNLQYATVDGCADESGIDSKQKSMMVELVEMAKTVGQKVKLLSYPPYGNILIK